MAAYPWASPQRVILVIVLSAQSIGFHPKARCVPIDTHPSTINARLVMVNSELLEIIVCPETMQTLKHADAETLGRVNQAVEDGSLENQGGDRVKDSIEEGLVREDGKVLYPVKDDIPVMLLDEAIRLDSLS